MSVKNKNVTVCAFGIILVRSRTFRNRSQANRNWTKNSRALSSSLAVLKDLLGATFGNTGPHNLMEVCVTKTLFPINPAIVEHSVCEFTVQQHDFSESGSFETAV